MSTPVFPLSHLKSGDGPRLSPRRRGSLAAPDPFGTLLVQDNERGVSSRLTITRAPQKTQIRDTEVKTWRRRSTGGNGKTSTPAGNGGRISFAFSAFTLISKDSGHRTGDVADVSAPAAPSSSSRILSRSKSFPAIESSLTPIQVYELAQQCNYPQTQPSTPDVCLPYTPLPDTVYLPFLDRPREVEALISTPPTSTLFSLLAQTFPSPLDAEDDADSARWTYPQLERWLTNVDRSEAGDLEWIQKARVCISAKSELIWERVKSALGVPHDLDTSPGEVVDTPSIGLDSSLEDKDPGKHAEEAQHYFEDAWVEPIMSSSSPHSSSPTAESSRPPSAGRQNIGRMDDIVEDAPVEADPVPMSSSPIVHGLRIITSPLEAPSGLESNLTPASAGSHLHAHLPYEAVAEGRPVSPLFPRSFANLAVAPTLSTNTSPSRSPIARPPSAYPF